MCNLKFWGGGFFQPAGQDYDLYLSIKSDMVLFGYTQP